MPSAMYVWRGSTTARTRARHRATDPALPWSHATLRVPAGTGTAIQSLRRLLRSAAAWSSARRARTARPEGESDVRPKAARTLERLGLGVLDLIEDGERCRRCADGPSSCLPDVDRLERGHGETEVRCGDGLDGQGFPRIGEDIQHPTASAPRPHPERRAERVAVTERALTDRHQLPRASGTRPSVPTLHASSVNAQAEVVGGHACDGVARRGWRSDRPRYRRPAIAKRVDLAWVSVWAPCAANERCSSADPTTSTRVPGSSSLDGYVT